MDQIFVKPSRVSQKSSARAKRDVLVVRDPINLKELKPEGEFKPRNSYWTRRVRCGDCSEGVPAKEKPTKMVAEYDDLLGNARPAEVVEEVSDSKKKKGNKK